MGRILPLACGMFLERGVLLEHNVLLEHDVLLEHWRWCGDWPLAGQGHRSPLSRRPWTGRRQRRRLALRPHRIQL
jgi:hypothetical protein